METLVVGGRFFLLTLSFRVLAFGGYFYPPILCCKREGSQYVFSALQGGSSCVYCVSSQGSQSAFSALKRGFQCAFFVRVFCVRALLF